MPTAYRTLTTSAPINDVVAATESALRRLGGTTSRSGPTTFVIQNGNNGVQLGFAAGLKATIDIRQTAANQFDIQADIKKSPNAVFWICFIVGFFLLWPLWIVCALYFFVNPNGAYQSALDSISVTSEAPLAPLASPVRKTVDMPPLSSLVDPIPAPAKQRIVISFRKNDERALAGRLQDTLGMDFGDGNVLEGVEKLIKPGDDFLDAIQDGIKASNALVVVIGAHWNDEAWLSNAHDYDRIAIETAIRERKKLIPILVNGATLPAELPEELKSLARRNALTMSDLSFRDDVKLLLSTLKGV